MGSWIATVICRYYRMAQRAAVLSRFLTLLQKCFALNNLHGSLAILSAFSNSAVARLKRTFAEVFFLKI